RIKAADRLALAPITRALISFSKWLRGDVTGKNSFAVAAQVTLDFFHERTEGIGGHGFAAFVEFAVLLFRKLELVAFVEAAIVQMRESAAIKSAGVLIGGRRVGRRAVENGVTRVGGFGFGAQRNVKDARGKNLAHAENFFGIRQVHQRV